MEWQTRENTTQSNQVHEFKNWFELAQRDDAKYNLAYAEDITEVRFETKQWLRSPPYNFEITLRIEFLILIWTAKLGFFGTRGVGWWRDGLRSRNESGRQAQTI